MCTCLGCISFVPNQLINSSNVAGLVRKIPYICIDALLYIYDKRLLWCFSLAFCICACLYNIVCLSYSQQISLNFGDNFFNILYVASFTKHLCFSLVTTSLYYIESHKILISKVADVIFLFRQNSDIFNLLFTLSFINLPFSFTEKNAGKNRWWRNIICKETNISVSLVIIYFEI